VAPSPAEQFQNWWRKLIEAVAAGRLTGPKGRSHPHLVKHRPEQYLPRKANDLLNLHHQWKLEIAK
jgi:hypothetical protein